MPEVNPQNRYVRPKAAINLNNGWVELLSYNRQLKHRKRIINTHQFTVVVKRSPFIKVWVNPEDNAPSPLFLVRFIDPMDRDTAKGYSHNQAYALARGEETLTLLAERHNQRIKDHNPHIDTDWISE